MSLGKEKRTHIRKILDTYIGQIASGRLNRPIGYPLLYTLP